MILRANIMVVPVKRLFAVSLLSVATLMVGAAAQAQTVERQRIDAEEYPTLQDEIEDTFFTEIGDLYRNNGLLGDLRDLFGPFPENAIVRDAARLNDLYREALLIQTTSDPTIRTPDLTNPFEESLLTIEPYMPPEPTPPVFVPPVVRSVPTAPPPPVAPAAPVRGLY